MRAELKELLERVEKATGPDRDLDDAIFDTLEAGDLPDAVYCYGEPIPKFTASIDAAVALVEKKLPGWNYGITKSLKDCMGSVSDERALVIGRGKAPALALIAALLKALIAQRGAAMDELLKNDGELY